MISYECAVSLLSLLYSATMMTMAAPPLAMDPAKVRCKSTSHLFPAKALAALAALALVAEGTKVACALHLRGVKEAPHGARVDAGGPGMRVGRLG